MIERAWGYQPPHVGKVIRRLRFASDQERVLSIDRSVDCNDDNMIDFNEFVHAIIEHRLPISEKRIKYHGS